MPDRVLVIVPTYNERENIEDIVRRVRGCEVCPDVLIVDDRSPDGTGELADQLADGDEHVHVLHRARKEGLGPAYLAGFEWGLDHDYDRLVEMDADGSHLPEQLSRLIEASQRADVVLGSRWVPGGRIVNWPWYRQAISRIGSWYARTALRLPIKDVTGGYRVFTAAALRRIPPAEIESHGYCFQIDMLRHAVQHGLHVTEVPITFVDRTRGESKMGMKIVVEAMLRVTLWGIEERSKVRVGAKSQI